MNSVRRYIPLLLLFALSLAATPVRAESAGGSADAHATASQSDSGPMGFDPDLAIFTAVVFLLLLLFMSKFAWKPIIEGIDKRESSIADQVDQANRNADKANDALKQYESKLAATREQVKTLIAQTRREAETAGEQIVADERSAAQQDRDKSLEDIRAAKEAARRELAPRGGDVAVLLASRLLNKDVDPQKHADLIS